MKLFIPVGVPGCGKSTFAERVLNHTNLRIVSTDGIREELVKAGKLKSVSDMSCNKEVFAKFYHRIEDHLLDHFDVYADATNLTNNARAKFWDISDHTGSEMHVIVFTNLVNAINRNRKRDRMVDSEPMIRMLSQYEKALGDIPTERYSTVTYVESFT